ncbi:type III-B CRISPR module RAMP protein Cmr6 [Thiospirillum jenense]|uniref:Type III-B CRISPR module RAMP protein Cmr6 n=1 Tax=Thiospirillum jenense TaxID=1653858 RepID=A0A839HDX6_9GAMM|nr:type III-B CRISPR module RAMP protein Cmr6 [Thiospirillum jenense]MBB1125586.1 type III-B CRISPR module RAMP protein Cmr6 [Thiospirillum jenense]
MAATELMREALRPLYRAANDAHPGLLIQRGFEQYDEENKTAKTAHLQRICAIPAGDFYHNAYQRWRTATADVRRFRQVILALESRLFIGLTGGGLLETGCAISHTYGMPYIPGSSIKGVVRAHVSGSLFARQHPAVIDELFGAAADPTGEQRDGLAGLVSFHDAWWVPGSAPASDKNRPLVEEIVTTHHLDYYGNEGATPASDLDSPVPNAQIAVQGSFLFVLEAPANALGWLDVAEQMLLAALASRGIGAKTRTGYGLFDPAPLVPAAPTCAWVDETIARLAQQNRASTDDTLRGKGLVNEWAALTDAALKAAALADIQSRWQAKGWWEQSLTGAAKYAKAIYTQ